MMMMMMRMTVEVGWGVGGCRRSRSQSLSPTPPLPSSLQATLFSPCKTHYPLPYSLQPTTLSILYSLLLATTHLHCLCNALPHPSIGTLYCTMTTHYIHVCMYHVHIEHNHCVCKYMMHKNYTLVYIESIGGLNFETLQKIIVFNRLQCWPADKLPPSTSTGTHSTGVCEKL